MNIVRHFSWKKNLFHIISCLFKRVSFHFFQGGVPHTAEESATCLQITYENIVQEDKHIRTNARKGLSFLKLFHRLFKCKDN